MIWFTADYHFYHSNIIKYCFRPFRDIYEMEYELIKRNNEVVKKDDILYVIGDIALPNKVTKYKLETTIAALNGKKYLIRGNHDKYSDDFYKKIGFEEVYDMLKVEEFNLVHDPAMVNLNLREKWLVGHVHNLFKFQKPALNVGVDVWNYYPVNIDQVRKIFEEHKNDVTCY